MPNLIVLNCCGIWPLAHCLCVKNTKNSFASGHNVLKSRKLCYLVLLHFQSFPLGSFLMALDVFF